MANADQLYKSTVRVSKARITPNDSPNIRIEKVIPYPKMKSVLFHGECYGLTVNRLHQVYLFFYPVIITKEVPDNKSDYFYIEYKGEVYFIQKPTLHKTNLRVRCSCVDFFFTFAYWNFVAGCLFGRKPRKYKPKSNRRPRNPGHHPGLCKHCFNVMRMLSKRKMIKG